MSALFKSWLAILTCCLLLWTGSARADKCIETYTGGFTSTQVECDTLCTGGPLTGGLAGQLSWRMDSMEATDDPNVVKLVGVNTITTADGTLSGTDYTIWNLATGQFIDFTVIDTGTGAFEGVRGTLIISGTFDPVAGAGTSNYIAILKLP